MVEIDPVFITLDRLIGLSRLNELAVLMSQDRTTRIASMVSALRRLRPGSYLLGTGPSTLGIIPLSVDEVVLGRSATPLEEHSDTVVDYAVADTPYFVPCEVSRAHAKILRQREQDGVTYAIVDLGSTCGTYINGHRLSSKAELVSLSLGPSQRSTYMFFVVSDEDSREC